MTRVLGLDLSIGTTGWAVVDNDPKIAVMATGEFKLPDRRPNEDRYEWNRRRLHALDAAVHDLIAQHAPNVVAWEYPDKPRSGFSGGTKGREFHAMQGLAMAEGFLISVLDRTHYPPVQRLAVSTSDAKRCAAGSPGASKLQVRRWLEIKYGWRLPGTMSSDQVDAIAVSIAALEPPRKELKAA